MKTNLRITRLTTEDFLKKVNVEINRDLELLHRIIYVKPDPTQVPVAFATNSLYVLERNGGLDREAYLSALLPILRAKAENLHAEGLAQAVWALSNAGVYEQDLWDTLKKQVLEKNFDYEYVKNERWSTGFYVTHSGSEHFMESELTDMARELYFQGKYSNLSSNVV